VIAKKSMGIGCFQPCDKKNTNKIERLAMKLKPIEDHIVVELSDEVTEKTVGGIIIPDTAKEKPQMAKVVAVGTDEDLKKIVKEGDTVLFGKYSGTEIELDNKKYLILSKKEILAIVE